MPLFHKSARPTKPKAELSTVVSKNELFLGDELKGILRVKSEEELDVENIRVYLRCTESVAVWDEENGEDWDEANLYNVYFQVSGSMHVTIGFNKEFPFVFKLPSIGGRETYHSVHHYVEWLLSSEMKVKGRWSIGEEETAILVAKRPASDKEVIREVVLIPCAYCSGLMPQTSIFCPNCGARRKG